MPNWEIAAEQGEQAGIGLPGVAANPGTMVADMSGMQVPMGSNVDSLRSAENSARSLASMTGEEKIVTIFAIDVTRQNAAWMERIAKATLRQRTQVTSALTIPTPIGSAIVSLTTTRTAPSTTTKGCAISTSDELMKTLKAMAQQNAQLLMLLSRVFENAVKPLLDVPRSAAPKMLGSSSGPAMVRSSVRRSVRALA